MAGLESQVQHNTRQLKARHLSITCTVTPVLVYLYISTGVTVQVIEPIGYV